MLIYRMRFLKKLINDNCLNSKSYQFYQMYSPEIYTEKRKEEGRKKKERNSVLCFK